MIRLMLSIALSLVWIAPSAAQTDASSTSFAQVLPFPTQWPERHAIELVLDGGSGEAFSVTVASAPEWLRFETPEALAGTTPETEAAEPVARLVFSVDRSAPVGEAAAVELVVTDADGVERARHAVAVEVSAPELALEVPRPNPSRGGAEVAFTVGEAGPVRLALYDVLGREVAVLVDGERSAGAHAVTVPGVASGTYVVRLAAGDEARVERLTVVR